MSGRFPGADNVREFWNNIIEGKETTRFFSDEEMDPFIDPVLRSDASYVKARGIINDADKFDASFFGLNPRLAELMDPQQRVFLEVCWEALEDSGYTSGQYNGLIGVFAGSGNNTYYTNNVLHHKDAVDKVGGFQVMVANEKDYIATRISHFMNLKGPGLSVHTACSTSLTAVAMAVQSLRSHHCDMAIAGGVAITSPVNSGHLYQEGGMFSSDGHTRSFDAKATGTVFSDGAGVVILKRYRDAVADGDTVYAVIRGIGINNDGSEKASFTAPSVEGQANAIAMAQADASVSPDSISYIETHGTATPLGDPIEVEALSLAFKGGTERKQFCAIGSVKSNFGHLTAAAGVAGLIKTALALKNKVIPASINFSAPNPAIDFGNSPFYVNNVLRTWENSLSPRRAGVSSFGVGGTNVHVVLEEAPEQLPSGPARSRHLLLFSAKNNERLKEGSEKFRTFFSENQQLNPADASYTLQTGRAHFNSRKFIVCDSVESAVRQIDQPIPALSASRQLEQPASGVVFMFPGQGSQYVNMGANLYRDEIVFKEAVDRCCELLLPHLNIDLRSVLYPAKADEDKASAKLQDTCYTQPALFTVGYALAKLWMSWGIQPQALTGHSIGEFCAACISGIMSLEDALMLVANRGRMMQELPGGSMLSVRLSADEVKSYLSDEVSVAAVNGPSLCVISGQHDAINSIQVKLEQSDIACKKLFTSHAFHSPMMDSIVDPFRELAGSIKLNPPSIPVVSTATATWLTPEQATDPSYWSMHLRLPVRFADAVRTIWEHDSNLFLLELGPRNTASTLARQQASDLKKQFAYPSLSDTAGNDAEWSTMLYAVGQLWLSGISIDWKSFYALEKRKRISLPTYPFERKRYWVDPLRESTGVNTFHPYQPFSAQMPEVGYGTEFILQNQLTQDNMSTVNRKQRIISELRSVMEDASGIELASADENASFMELGMDSLFLTQAALTISKKYGTKITFRQLNENFSSLGSLAAHIDSVMPPKPKHRFKEWRALQILYRW
jgi:acyl transferase domain-containing protein